MQFSLNGLIRPRRTGKLQPSDQAEIKAVRRVAERLEPLPDNELVKLANYARQALTNTSKPNQATARQAFALAIEAVRRTMGYRLYDVQVLAALTLSKGAIAEMHTGEGKTLSAAPAAIFQGLAGQGVHVATTNSYLASRDCEIIRPACEMLGLSIECLQEDLSHEDKYHVYQCDVTYGTGYEFGFDYLRDQLALRSAQDASLGQNLLDHLTNQANATPASLQRGLAFSIVDEVDHVLLDEASSPLILSEQSATEASDADVFRHAKRVAEQLTENEHYSIDRGLGRVSIHDETVERLHRPQVGIPIKSLQRPWIEYVKGALQADHLFQRDIHYVVDDADVQIVDASTGRIFADRSWQDGLHQAVEAKEGLTISSDKSVLAQITRQRFFRHYSCFSGMTGTAQGCEREFRQVYRLPVVPIPLRVPSQRRSETMRFFSTREAKFEAIAKDVGDIHRTGRPILVGTRTIQDSEALWELFQQRSLPAQILNGTQDAEEAEVVACAGDEGNITIATNMAGRGTDIKLSSRVKQLGGLHVALVECDQSIRVDRQLEGRAGRQGDPGSCRSYVCAEDMLLVHHGQWMASSLTRLADATGEVRASLEPGIRRIQRSAERRQYAARVALFRRDLADRRSF